MIGVHYTLVVLDPYSLGVQLEGVTGEFQGLRRVFVAGGMVNRHVLVFRYPFHDINMKTLAPLFSQEAILGAV